MKLMTLMNPTLAPEHRTPARWPRPAALWHEALRREPVLMWFAVGMLLAMLPTAVALGLDDRMLRGVNVWAKPLKFMASLALFSASTAWFIGLLPEPRRRAGPVRALVWTQVVAGTLEVGYICWQAGLGEASHYNRSDALHQLLYGVMGLLALALMSTQLVLAWQIVRHGRSDAEPAWRAAVVLGLVMTVVLGVAAALPLASAQPPSGAGLWPFGWHLGGGDLRPAHFIGSHAQQFIPFAGWLLLRAWPRRAGIVVALFAVGYTALWVWALQSGLRGAVWLPPN